jgi:hypothetical protein
MAIGENMLGMLLPVLEVVTSISTETAPATF